MIYFTEDYVQFFGNLTLNNNKEWFDLHRHKYEKHVREPFKVFATDLLNGMKKIDKDIEVEGTKAMVRINKDVRFSRDESPYRNYMGVGFGIDKNDTITWPGYFISVGAVNGVEVRGGMYMPGTKIKNVIQKSMADNPEEFMKIVKSNKFKKHWDGVNGEHNKRVPKDWEKALESNPYILNKTWTYGKEYPVDLALTDDLLPTILADYKASMEFQNYFKKFCLSHEE